MQLYIIMLILSAYVLYYCPTTSRGSGTCLVLPAAVSPMSNPMPGIQRAPSIHGMNSCFQMSAQKSVLWWPLALTHRPGCPWGGDQEHNPNPEP